MTVYVIPMDLLCLLGRMPRGTGLGWNFYCFQERGKCCTIFDFENCAVVNLLAAVFMWTWHPLEAGDSSAWHPLDSAEHPLEDMTVS